MLTVVQLLLSRGAQLVEETEDDCNTVAWARRRYSDASCAGKDVGPSSKLLALVLGASSGSTGSSNSRQGKGTGSKHALPIASPGGEHPAEDVRSVLRHVLRYSRERQHSIAITHPDCATAVLAAAAGCGPPMRDVAHRMLALGANPDGILLSEHLRAARAARKARRQQRQASSATAAGPAAAQASTMSPQQQQADSDSEMEGDGRAYLHCTAPAANGGAAPVNGKREGSGRRHGDTMAYKSMNGVVGSGQHDNSQPALAAHASEADNNQQQGVSLVPGGCLLEQRQQDKLPQQDQNEEHCPSPKACAANGCCAAAAAAAADASQPNGVHAVSNGHCNGTEVDVVVWDEGADEEQEQASQQAQEQVHEIKEQPQPHEHQAQSGEAEEQQEEDEEEEESGLELERFVLSPLAEAAAAGDAYMVQLLLEVRGKVAPCPVNDSGWLQASSCVPGTRALPAPPTTTTTTSSVLAMPQQLLLAFPPLQPAS